MCCCPSAGAKLELWALINLRNRKQKSSNWRRAAGRWLETSRWAAEFSITPQRPETNVYRPDSDTETGWGVFTDSWFHVSASSAFILNLNRCFLERLLFLPSKLVRNTLLQTHWGRTKAPLLYGVLPNVLFEQAAEQMSPAHLKDTTSLQNYRCLSEIKHVVSLGHID